MREHNDRCGSAESALSRRGFLGVAAAAVAGGLTANQAQADSKGKSESLVKTLHESLSDEQKKTICFPWEHKDRRGLLRTHISNNWRITRPAIKGDDFYTKDQQELIRKAWEGIVNPAWVERFDKQFKDDMGGFGVRQGIAIFGTPGSGKFEFVLSGRHGTVRCDGDSTDHVCFGGPIVYGHAASGYYEKPAHPNNVFWHQAVAANDLFKMLDGKQQAQALLPEAPDEARIGFREEIDGIPIADLSKDQKKLAQEVLLKLIEPFRQADQQEALAALKKNGGLDKCNLIFYKADDLGADKLWDNWRLEGPTFVWHYRGAPHVHVWVNVADDRNIELNSKNLSGPLRQK